MEIFRVVFCFDENLVSQVQAAAASLLDARGPGDHFELHCVCTKAAGIAQAPLEQVIKIALGRLLHLNSVPTFYLGRMMNLLLFAILGMLAVRKMPFGKNILFATALLPLTLQQVASYSYDSVIIAFAFYYVATCFDLAFWINFFFCP